MNSARQLSFGLFAATVLLTAPTLSAGSPTHPIAARIVDQRGEPQHKDQFEDVVGYVQVMLSNGHEQVWTGSMQCELPKVSKSGLVGWTYAAGRHSRGPWMNNELCVASSRRDVTHFQASRAFIEIWGFAEHDTCVVTRSRNIHGPSWVERFRIDTGELVDECSGSNYADKTPEWARPYLDEQ